MRSAAALQAREPAGQRLGGQRAGEQRDRRRRARRRSTRRRSTAETCSWTSRSGACDEHARRPCPVRRRRTSSTAVRPPGRFAARSTGRGAAMAVSSTSSSASGERARGAESAHGSSADPLTLKTVMRAAPAACPRGSAARLRCSALPRNVLVPGARVARLDARAQRGDARLLEVVLQRRQHERREHDQREQRRGRSDHREPHAQAAGALQRRADHATEAVPDAAHGPDQQRRRRIALELLAQVPDVHVDRALLAVVGRVPDALEQGAAARARGRASASALRRISNST